MFEKLAATYKKPIKILLDNASYQRCIFVRENATRLGIELIFLPTYSPNLNLIERAWKFVKARVLNCAYHDTFADFSSKIFDCVEHIHVNHVADMSKLITSNFHIVDTDNIIS